MQPVRGGLEGPRGSIEVEARQEFEQTREETKRKRGGSEEADCFLRSGTKTEWVIQI